MKNYFDRNGNYINVENLSLADIYHRAFALGVESVDITPLKKSRENSSPFDDCYPCTNCQEFECDGCKYNGLKHSQS